MAFDPHGSYDIRFVGEIVSLKLMGSWNLEQAKTFFTAYKAAILEKRFERFGVMSNFCGLDGATPDCIAYFETISDWAREQGQVARAQILDSGLKAYIADKGTQDKEIFPIRSFESEAEALAWLADLGLCPDIS